MSRNAKHSDRSPPKTRDRALMDPKEDFPVEDLSCDQSDAAATVDDSMTVDESSAGDSPTDADRTITQPILDARPPDSDHSAIIFGNYEIHGWLGQGGMGTVYRARHRKLNKEVALKLIRPRNQSNSTAQFRFDRELRAAGKLDHPNIVRALDAGEINQVTFLSMEMLQGADLDELTQYQRVLSIADASEVIRQAAMGLQFIHDNDLVHRDIKPSNLMLATDPIHTVCVKLLDLGLALAKNDVDDERLTGEGKAIGTFRYMSPEQARDTHSVDFRADVYSLGATFFRLLTGEAPFSKARYPSHAQLLLALTNGQAPDIGEMIDGLPQPLVVLISRMLSPAPENRPANLTEVMETLAPFAKSHQLSELLDRSFQQQRETDREASPPEAWQLSLVDELQGRCWGNTASSDASGSFATSSHWDSHSSLFDPQNNDLETLRQRVKKFWIDGVLQRTRENTRLLSLHREMLTDRVASPWEGVAEIPLHSSDADAPIGQLFDESERSLLILGEAGAGKSTTLLELAQSLLNRSGEIAPVLLHLSSWSSNAQTLDRWVVQEMSAKYQVPRRIGRELIEQNRLILLLDGMDEVRADEQHSCIVAINEFSLQYDAPGIAVCSRFEEYSAIGARLTMHGAVLLKPLTSDQILSSISDSTTENAPLLEAIKQHDALLDLASSPLMLSVMKLSFDGGSGESLNPTETIENTRERLFDQYVDRVFRSKGTSNAPYSKPQTISCLAWMADQMKARNQTVFQIEDLQPDWLETRSQKFAYVLSVSLLAGFPLGIFTLYYWLHAMPIMDTTSSTSQQSLLWLVVQIPVLWMFISWFDLVLFSKQRCESFKRRLFYGLSKTILYWTLWMAWPLVGYLTGTWSSGWIVSNVIIGVITGGALGMLGRNKRLTADVDVVHSLGVSAWGSLQGWLWGLLLGYCVYLTYLCLWAFYFLETVPEWFPYYWYSSEELCVSICWPLLGGAVGLVTGGLVPKMRKTRTTSTQTINTYIRSIAIASGFSLVVVSATTLLVLEYWVNLPDNKLDFSFAEKLWIVSGFAIWSSFYVALCFGALDLLKHSLTRFFLTFNQAVPDRLPAFLKHSSRLGFLRHAGGNYIFSHGLLMDYFASKTPSARRPDSETDGA